MDPVGQARRACKATRRSAAVTGWVLTNDVSGAWPNTCGAICRQGSQSMQVESTKKSPGAFSGTRLLGFAIAKSSLPGPHSSQQVPRKVIAVLLLKVGTPPVLAGNHSPARRRSAPAGHRLGVVVDGAVVYRQLL